MVTYDGDPTAANGGTAAADSNTAAASDKQLLLRTLHHVRALNCELTVQRLERILGVYRAWVAVPGSVEGGFALTRDELECVLEFPSNPHSAAFLFETFATPPLQRVDLLTLLVSAALVCRGSLEAKAKFVFTLVDLDTEDDIVEEELAVVVSVCSNGLERLGVHSASLLETDALAIAYEAFEFVGVEDGGKMSFAAFLRWCVFHNRPRALFNRIRFLVAMGGIVTALHDALAQRAEQTRSSDAFARYNTLHVRADDDDAAHALQLPTVLVGPIIGKVTASSVTLLLEIDCSATVEVFAFEVSARSRAPRLGVSIQSAMYAHEPRVLVLDGLKPSTTYTLRLLGVKRRDREQRVAYVTTTTAAHTREDCEAEPSAANDDEPLKWTIRALNHSSSIATPPLTAFEHAMYAKAAHKGYCCAPTPLLTLHFASLRIPRATVRAMAALLARDRDGNAAVVSAMLVQCYRKLLNRRELAPLLRFQANVLLDRSDDVLFGDDAPAKRSARSMPLDGACDSSGSGGGGETSEMDDCSNGASLLATLARPIWKRYVGDLGGFGRDGVDDDTLCLDADGVLLLVLPDANEQPLANAINYALAARLVTMLEAHPDATSLVLVSRSPLLSPLHNAAANTSEQQQQQQVLEQLVAWKRHALARSIVLLAFARSFGCESALSVKDTTITIRQSICGPLRGVVQSVACGDDIDDDGSSSRCRDAQLVTAESEQRVLEKFVMRHGTIELGAHMAILNVEVNTKEHRVKLAPTLELLHPARAIRVLVGPVVGWVSSTSARILLECDAEGDVTCVFTDRITGDRVATTQRTRHCMPVIFHTQQLQPGRLYNVHFRGLAQSCRAVVQTAYDAPVPSWTLVAVSDDLVLDGSVRFGAMAGGADDAANASLVGDIVHHVLPAAPGLRADATLHLGATVALAHDLLTAYRLCVQTPDRFDSVRYDMRPASASSSASSSFEPTILCEKLVRQCVRRHWSLPDHQLLFARGAHVFASVGLLRSLLQNVSTSDGVPCSFLALVRRVVREYEAVGGRAAAAPGASSCIQRLPGSSGVVLLTLDTLENIVDKHCDGNSSSEQFAQLQATLLSADQWRAVESLLDESSSSGNDSDRNDATLQLLVILCDVPLVWQDAESDTRALWQAPLSRLPTVAAKSLPLPGVFGNAWSLYPDELDKLLGLIFRKKQQDPAFHVTVLCSGPRASRTMICDARTQLTLEQIVLGPVSIPATTVTAGDDTAVATTALAREGELLDARYAYTHEFPAGAYRAAQYCVLDLVAHAGGSSSATRIVVQQQPVARILVGPVIGRVTPRSARILLELDRAVPKCVCVLTDTTSDQRFVAEMSIEAFTPTVFKLDSLRPDSRYAVSFEGVLASRDDARGYVQTPPLVAMSFEWIAAQHHAMEHFVSATTASSPTSSSTSSWSRLVQRGMRSYTAHACAATSAANGDTLGERHDVDHAQFNPWFAVEDAFLSAPMQQPQLVVHLGGQVDMRTAFSDDELRALVTRLGTDAADGGSGASDRDTALLSEVRHRVQDVYRVAWGVPPRKDMLAYASNLMLLNEEFDLFFSTARLEAIVSDAAGPAPTIARDDGRAVIVARAAALLRAMAFECWQLYQNQLWVDVNERDVVPNAVKNSTKFAFAATFGICRVVFLNVSHDVHELHSAAVAMPSPASPTRHTATTTTTTAATANTSDAAPVNLFTNATWKTLEDALLPSTTVASSATAPSLAIQQLVVIVPADLIAWTSAFPQLRPDIARVFEKVFAWKMADSRARRATIVCSSDRGSSRSFDVTDEKFGETLALSCVGSISEPRALGAASSDKRKTKTSSSAGASASKKKLSMAATSVVKGYFSKRFTYESTMSLAVATVAAPSQQQQNVSSSSSNSTAAQLRSRTFASFQFLSDFHVGVLHEQLHYFPPRASPRATLGPVLGRIVFTSRDNTAAVASKVSPSDAPIASSAAADAADAADLDLIDAAERTPTATALILLEINADARVACVVTDSLVNTDIHVVAELARDCPHVFAVAGLQPERRYMYRFEGIANAAARRGCFHTPPAAARAMNVVALSSSFPEQLDPAHESLWHALLERVQLPWCSIDAVLHLGGQVPLHEAAVECVEWLERELCTPQSRHASDETTATEMLQRRVRQRFQQRYRTRWNLPHVRELLASVSNWFHPTQTDVAPFLCNQYAPRSRAEQIVLDVAQRVVADYQLALMRYDALGDVCGAVETAAAVDRQQRDASVDAVDLQTTSGATLLASDTADADTATDSATQSTGANTTPSLPLLADTTVIATADVTVPFAVSAFVELGEIGFFFCDMRAVAPDTCTAITCNGRLTTPLKAHEHAVMDDKQWLRLETALKRKRVLLLVLCMEFPLVLTSAEHVDRVRDAQQLAPTSTVTTPTRNNRLYDHTALAQHWIACPRQLEQLLALLFRWKAKRRGRDVLVLSGGVKIGLDTLVQETTCDVSSSSNSNITSDAAASASVPRKLSLRNLTCGPIAARVEPFEFPLSGVACRTSSTDANVRDDRFTFVHRPVAQPNYVLAQLTIALDTLAAASSTADAANSDNVLAATVDAAFVFQDDPRVSPAHDAVLQSRHPLTTCQRFPSWWRAYIPMGRAVFWDDTVTLRAATDDGMQALHQFVYTERSFVAALDVFYEQHAFADTVRLAELRSATRGVQHVDRAQQLRAVLADVWRAIPEAKRAHMASLLDPFVADFLLVHVGSSHTGAVDSDAPIELEAFRALCRDVVFNACVLHLAVHSQRADALQAIAQAKRDAADRAQRDAVEREQQDAARKQDELRLEQLRRSDPLAYAHEMLARDAAANEQREQRRRDKLARKQAARLRELDEEHAIAKEQKALGVLAESDVVEYARRQQLLATRVRRLDETRAQRAAAKAHKQQQQQQQQQRENSAA